MQRKETVCAPQWFGFIDDAFAMYKREAVSKLLHERRWSNIVKPDSGIVPEHAEGEETKILGSEWYNPWDWWKGNSGFRQEYGVANPCTHESIVYQNNWPISIRPSPEIIKHFDEKMNYVYK
jgi:hypothetical protein